MDSNKIEEKALKAVRRRSAWSRGVGEFQALNEDVPF